MINKSFDKIAEHNGYHLTYDGIHATSKGTSIIANLVSSILENKKIKQKP